MDIHIDSADVRDNRDLSADASFLGRRGFREGDECGDGDLPIANQADQARVKAELAEKSLVLPIPRNMRPVGLKSVTYVRPADAMGGEEWDVEIEGRLRGVIGSSPPPGDPGADMDAAEIRRLDEVKGAELDTEYEEEGLGIPTTQPIGPSSLARQFSKTPAKEVPGELSPGIQLQEDGDTGIARHSKVKTGCKRPHSAEDPASGSTTFETATGFAPALVPAIAPSLPSPRSAPRPSDPNVPASSSPARSEDDSVSKSSQERRSRGRFIFPPSSVSNSSDGLGRTAPLATSTALMPRAAPESTPTKGTPRKISPLPFRSGGGLRAEGGFPRYDFGTSAW